MRIVVPSHQSEHVARPARGHAVGLQRDLPRARRAQAEGDVILCDVAREDASVLVSDLRELDVDTRGLDRDRAHRLGDLAGGRRGGRGGGRGKPGDAVVWEEVEARTSENIELTGDFLAFMALACLIASVGIFLDSPILIVGAMIVGPEFGPIAGLCVALVQRRARRRQALAHGARDRLPGRDHRRVPVRALRSDAARPDPGRLLASTTTRSPTSSPTPTRSRSSSPSSPAPPGCCR